MSTLKQIDEFYSLAKEWPEGLEHCPWWAKCIRYEGFECWYTNSYGNSEIIDNEHALALLRWEAWGHLAGMGWLKDTTGGLITPDGNSTLDDIIDALKHAQGQA